MVNRTIQQKILKMKRRNRYARLSGATSKSQTRAGPSPFTEDEYGNTTTLRTREILVGPISLSKQVINTGRGPDNERMQEYYQRLYSFDQPLPDTIGAVSIDKVTTGRRTESGLRLKDLENTYANFIKGVPKEHRINYVDDDSARLDLFFAGPQWFWVEVDYRKKFCRRSKVYPNKKTAELYMFEESLKVTWVETI